ncbi:MAG: DUF4388 domain-containing protein [Planctomycetes bacterium]|nr:DUF4388 domain-containing protein [Planctomycetota bacterium]
MSDVENQTAGAVPARADELKANVWSLVDALVAKDEEGYESEFVELVTQVTGLIDRKLRMEGTKTDTRDFLGEMLFTRLRRGMHLFLKSEDEVLASRAAEWVMGVLFSVTTLTEFARAFDRALIGSRSGNTDFNFAGRTDFISVEEVMQMLSQGKRIGCLSLEKDDNRLDIYLKDGRIFFLDPHHLIRRVMPGSDAMQHREITESQVTGAEGERNRSGKPALLSLCDEGVFQGLDRISILRQFGKEVLFDFMRSSEPYAFYYRSHDELPAFAIDNDIRVGVTSLLLEGSKQLDDWQQMLAVIPDPDMPLEPKADMFARMSDIALGVLEIKLISQINGDTTPRSLVPLLGLPLFDIYVLLIKLSRDGVIAVPGGDAAIDSMTLSVEESMQEAFAALDANDDDNQRKSAIDRVFGDEGDDLQGSAASALDAVLGDSIVDTKRSKAKVKTGDNGTDLDQDLLSILRRSKE